LIQANGGHAAFFIADVGDEQAVRALIRFAEMLSAASTSSSITPPRPMCRPTRSSSMLNTSVFLPALPPVLANAARISIRL
jgi:hypothetical protein